MLPSRTNAPASAAAGFVIIFIGVGTFGSLGTNMVVGSVPPERGGSAAALSSISGDLGNALGVATLGSLGAAVYRDTLAPPASTPAEAADAAGASMEDAVTAAGGLPAEAAEALMAAAKAAYTNGLNTIGIACAVITAVSAVISLTMLRKRGGTVPSGEVPQQRENQHEGSTGAAADSLSTPG
ncbi:hypothetical protein GCM10010449_38790 [Streptomyces rectiviolaceus]|uniref:MFS transporter n=1 Tax=Streptomyces rectiviolaceus TaxID=332591 RepID=A0ABP6MGJ8_9ACTN